MYKVYASVVELHSALTFGGFQEQTDPPRSRICIGARNEVKCLDKDYSWQR